MKYDFTSIIERKGMDSIAVDAVYDSDGSFAPRKPKGDFDVIPMWVADMSFKTAPCVVDAIKKRLEHQIFGYLSPYDRYYDAIINWHKERNGVDYIEKKHIGHLNGVLGGVVAAASVFCSKGDNILIHSPTYVGFNHSLIDSGYNLVRSPLVLDEGGVLRMDFEDMEQKIIKHKIHTAVFCSPHNPSGRVWERWEIEKAMELFKKHDVFVISDEIWADLTLYNNQHIPTQSISEDAKMRTVALYAPSKTFNLAGLVGSYSVVLNPRIKDRFDKEVSLPHLNGMNVLSMHGLLGAYTKDGQEWVDELREVIAGNVDFACDYIEKHFDGVEFSKPQGTYMLFLDCTKWCEKRNKTIEDVLNSAWDVGVAVQSGKQFCGNCHVRVNLALPLEKLKEAFDRLDKYVFNA